MRGGPGLDPREPGTAAGRPRLGAEVLIVLGLSFGQAAIYALLRLIRRLGEAESLRNQTAAINTSVTDVGWLDVTYQLVGAAFALVPVGLALYLLAVRPALANAGGAAWAPGNDLATPLDPKWPPVAGQSAAAGASGRSKAVRPGTLLGLDLTQPLRDLGLGAALAAVIGLPGIGLYFLGRQLGVTVQVTTNNLGDHWWTLPVLVIAAFAAGASEEVVVVGYLVRRLEALAWAPWAIFLASATLRGTYHLYQGVGPFFGNLAMGLVFVWVFRRWGRVTPLLLAHWIMDIVAYVGPSLVGWPA